MLPLLKSRFRQLVNILEQTGKRPVILVSLLSAGILLTMGYFSIEVFGFLYHQEEFPVFFKLFLCEKILTMTFLTMFMLLIMSALASTINIFFLSRDLQLLLSSPVPAWKVFAWKSIEVATSSALMVTFFSLPVLFGYSYYFAPTAADIAAIVLVLVLFMVLGVLLGILIGMIVPAYFSVKKLQPILSLVGILLISGIVIFLRMLRPERFGNPDEIRNLMNYMGELKTEFLDYFPFAWIAKALHSLARQDYAAYFLPVAAFTGIIFALLWVIFFLQKRYYLKLFDKLNKGSSGGYRSRWKKSSLFKGDYAALWQKEIKTFLRSPGQWSQLLIVGAIVIVFILNIKGIPMAHPSVKNLISYLNLGMAAFVVVGLNSRFTFTSIPMESPGIVHLVSSPFQRRKLLYFKLVFFNVPQVLLGFLLFFAGDISLKLDGFARLSGIAFLLPVLPFLTVLAVYYSLKVEDGIPLSPQHLVASRNGISYMIWSMLYIVLGMIYFLRPMFAYYFYRITGRDIPVLEIALWFGGFFLINLGLSYFFYRRGLTLLNKKEFSL